MTAAEAWIVTALGIGVVYVGLILCIVFINLFSRLAKRITWDGAHGHEAPAAAPAPAPTPAEPVPATPGEPIPPDVLAVIAATLEIERRLYMSRPGQRLTLVR